MTDAEGEIGGLEHLSFQSAVTYTIIEELGRGGMGVVCLAEREANVVSPDSIGSTSGITTACCA